MRLNYHKKKKAAEENFDVDRKDYDNMTVHELKYLGKIRKIKYCSAMSRDKLIEMLRLNDENPSVKSDPEFDKKCQEEGLKKCRKHGEKIKIC